MVESEAAVEPSAVSTATYVLSPLVRIDRPVKGSAGWRIGAGSGERREFLDVDNPALLNWLIAQGGEFEHADLSRSFHQDLGVSVEDAAQLIDALVLARVFIPPSEADELRAKGARWERSGWRDAFDFHFAVRATSFDPERGKPYEDAMRAYLADTSESGPQPDAIVSRLGCPRIDLDPFVRRFNDARTRPLSLRDAFVQTVPLNRFAEQGIDADRLAAMLQAAHGVHFSRQLVLGEHLFKASPSGGARQPVEVYVAARAVNGLAPGIYHYQSRDNVLEMVRGDEALELVNPACFDKGGIQTASAVVFVTYRLVRHAWKYRYSRTYRMVLLELGHNFQTQRIAAALAGLEVYYNPAIDDYLVADLLDIPDDCEEAPMYSVGLGLGGTV